MSDTFNLGDFLPSDDDEKKVERIVIKNLAKGVFLKYLTDDNPSTTNGLTGLEQAIVYEFDIQSREQLYEIKRAVLLMANSFNGGCDMFREEEPDFEF